MARKPVKMPGRPAKKQPKVRKFAAGDLVTRADKPSTPERYYTENFAAQPGVLAERYRPDFSGPAYQEKTPEQRTEAIRLNQRQVAGPPGVLSGQPAGIPEQQRGAQVTRATEAMGQAAQGFGNLGRAVAGDYNSVKESLKRDAGVIGGYLGRSGAAAVDAARGAAGSAGDAIARAQNGVDPQGLGTDRFSRGVDAAVQAVREVVPQVVHPRAQAAIDAFGKAAEIWKPETRRAITAVEQRPPEPSLRDRMRSFGDYVDAQEARIGDALKARLANASRLPSGAVSPFGTAQAAEVPAPDSVGPNPVPTARPGWNDPWAQTVKEGAAGPSAPPKPTNAAPQQTPAPPSRDTMSAEQIQAAIRDKLPAGVPGASRLSAQEAQSIAMPKAPTMLGGPDLSATQNAPSAIDWNRPQASQGAFTADGRALAIPDAKRTNTVSSKYIGALATGGSNQAEYDRDLMAKWYSMSPGERGNMPSSVWAAANRGATPQETAMNVARARIMDAGLPPERQAEALARLETIQTQIQRQLAESGHWQRQDDTDSRQADNQGRYWERQAGTAERQAGTAERQAENENLYQTRRNDIDAARQQAEAAYQQGALGEAQAKGRAERARGEILPAVQPDADLMGTLSETGDARANYMQSIKDQNAARNRAALLWEQAKAKNPGASPLELKRWIAENYPDEITSVLPWIAPTYAAGGPVQAPTYGGTPAVPQVSPVVQAYRDYMLKAQQTGVPVVPFQQFAQLKSMTMQAPPQAQPGALGMAGGGSVPVAGKLVVDTDPQAGVDSIPATIDGKAPAALNSGEFVIPTDVVNYYGTKFLNGLLDRARTAGEKNAQPAG